MSDYINSYQYVTTQLWQSGSTANPIISELPFTGVNFTKQLNSIGTFQGHLLLSGVNANDLNVYNGTIPGKTALYVLHNGDIVWAGIIWNREYDSASQIMNITGQEMLSYFQRRRITLFTSSSYYSANISGNGPGLNYSSVDPCAIARDLIIQAQAATHGKLGITTTAHTSGLSTTKIYYNYEFKSVYQAIKDLAQNYFDFKIYSYVSGGQIVNDFEMGTPLGNTYSSSSRIAPVFDFPGNIVSYRYPEDAQTAANTLYGLGYGANTTKLTATAIDGSKVVPKTITNVSGNGTLVTYTVSGTNYFSAGQIIQVTGVTPSQYNLTGKVVSSTSSQFTISSTATGTYSSGGTANPDWPLLEDSVNYIDIGSLSLLKDVTLGKLNAISYPPTTLQIIVPTYATPLFGTYDIGDEVRVTITDDFFPNGMNEIFRIVAIDVSPGENGPDRVTITLTKQLASGTVS